MTCLLRLTGRLELISTGLEESYIVCDSDLHEIPLRVFV